MVTEKLRTFAAELAAWREVTLGADFSAQR